MSGAWWDKIGDYASDLGADVADAAGTYVKGVVKQKLQDKQTAPSAAPVAHVGENGTGGAMAVTPQAQGSAAGFWAGLPSWSKATLMASGAVLVLAVGWRVVR